MIRIKRAYERAMSDDGLRILVDRLWPRGVSKAVAHADMWLREIAPSDNLRKWFSHDPERWPAFHEKYRQELLTKKELLEKIISLERERGAVTLIYSAKDNEHNNAMVVAELLRQLHMMEASIRAH